MQDTQLGYAAPVAPTSESRRAVRRTIELDCLVYCDLYGEPVELLMSDLSEDGLWIDTQLPLDVGTQVTVSFQPEDWDAPLCVAGRVRRVELSRRGQDSGGAGMGIGFELLRPDERRKLMRTLRLLKPRGARSVTQKTLLGVPVGPPPQSERRARFRRTKLGWATPAPDLATPRTSPSKQERRASWPPAPERRVTSSGFRGGLQLISSVFGREPK